VRRPRFSSQSCGGLEKKSQCASSSAQCREQFGLRRALRLHKELAEHPKTSSEVPDGRTGRLVLWRIGDLDVSQLMTLRADFNVNDDTPYKVSFNQGGISCPITPSNQGQSLDPEQKNAILHSYFDTAAVLEVRLDDAYLAGGCTSELPYQSLQTDVHLCTTQAGDACSARKTSRARWHRDQAPASPSTRSTARA